MITEYLKLCVDYDNPPNNTKYCVQNMLRSLQETPMGKKFLESHTTEQMCELWGLKDYCRQKQQMKVKFGNVERRSLIADNESLKKKNKLIDELIQHKTIFLRSNYHNGKNAFHFVFLSDKNSIFYENDSVSVKISLSFI